MKVVLASQNQGKIQELKDALKSIRIELIPLSHFTDKTLSETGLSFLENALEKARYASKITGLPAIADDSGLVVPYLHGEPGIYSARYAGSFASAQENIGKLLLALKFVPAKKRIAYFYCIIVFIQYDKDPIPLVCEGTWVGSIAKRERGEKGFGYDPIFYDSTLKKTAAELPLQRKNKMSHRGKAIKLLIKKLPDKLHPYHL